MHHTIAGVIAPALGQLTALAADPNITRVAARCGTSQPTLSRSLRAWATALDVDVVEADGRGIRLTADGRALAAAAAAAARLLDEALQRPDDEQTREALLRIGFLRSLGPTVASELVASFMAARRDAVVVHREGATQALIDAVESGRLDVAIISPRPPGHLRWLPLGRQEFVLVTPAGHPLAHHSRCALVAVRDEPFLALDSRFDARTRADALCAQAGFTPRIVLEADDPLTVRGYVAAGLGVAVLPADVSLDPRTANVSIDGDDADRVFGLAWNPQRGRDITDALLAHATALSKQYPAWADLLG